MSIVENQPPSSPMGCGFYRHGQVIDETRERYAMHRPFGDCLREVQRHLCRCISGTMECTEWLPSTYNETSCVSGCGNISHKDVITWEKRVRYSGVDCTNQTQVLGLECTGQNNGSLGELSTLKNWCVFQDGQCDEAPLFEYDWCPWSSWQDALNAGRQTDLYNPPEPPFIAPSPPPLPVQRGQSVTSTIVVVFVIAIFVPVGAGLAYIGMGRFLRNSGSN